MSRRGQLGSVSSTSVVSSAPSDADALLDALVGAAQQQHKARRLSKGKGKAEGNHHHNNKNSRRSSRHSLPFIKADLRPGASEGGEQLPRVRLWGVQRGAGGRVVSYRAQLVPGYEHDSGNISQGKSPRNS